MSLTFIHSRLAITSILYIGILSIWGFITFFRKRPADSNYWGALAIGEVLLIIQAVLGGILYFGGLGESASFDLILQVRVRGLIDDSNNPIIDLDPTFLILTIVIAALIAIIIILALFIIKRF